RPIFRWISADCHQTETRPSHNCRRAPLGSGRRRRHAVTGIVHPGSLFCETECDMLKKALVAAAATVLLWSGAQAAEISGAGATFPYPIYAKWAEAYKAKTG